MTAASFLLLWNVSRSSTSKLQFLKVFIIQQQSGGDLEELLFQSDKRIITLKMWYSGSFGKMEDQQQKHSLSWEDNLLGLDYVIAITRSTYQLIF